MAANWIHPEDLFKTSFQLKKTPQLYVKNYNKTNFKVMIL